MQLKFQHRGRQFFFVTVGLQGRPAVLSQVVEGEKRPRLTELGEAVKAGFLALHKIYPALTASDAVVMPDHFHLLLIVNYEVTPSLDPLWVCQRMLEAIEAAWALGPRGAGEVERLLRKAVALGRQHAADYYAAVEARGGRTGGAAPRSPQANGSAMAPQGATSGRAMAPQCATSGRAMAPQGATSGRAMAPQGAASKERDYPRHTEALLAAIGVTAGERGVQPPVRPPLPRFERSPWIDLSFDARQLAATRHYIRLNPDRYLWKRAHPDLFLCHRALKAARLARFTPQTFDGLGNLPLLGSPFLFHVRLTLKKTVDEHAEAIAEIVDRARRGWVPVSGFISPGEKEALRQLKAEPRARFIRLLPHALPPRYDPSAEDSREIAAGRMAILALHGDTTAIGTMAMKRDPAAAHQFRANCLAMNEIGAKLCGI